MRKRNYLFAFISMAIAIILGALGAHALKDHLNADQIESFKTGVFYQIIHALAIIGLMNLSKSTKSKKFKNGIRLLKVGPIIFSGSIYLLACQDILMISPAAKFLGPITPIGGLLMIIGWVLLAISMYHTELSKNH